MTNDILPGKSQLQTAADIYLHPKYADRHGLIAVFATNRRDGMIEALAKSAMRNAGGRLGSALLRGVPGSLLRK